MDFETRYKKLNARQKDAVDTIEGPLMVVAGPGTGKTELLSMRAANILRRTDTLPENILCLTFTESGAAAMRRRLTEIIGKDAYKVAIHTFHSFGSEVINKNSEYFYQGADFRPASDLSAYELLRTIFDTLDFSNPLSGKMNEEYTHLPDTLTAISELKKSGLTNEELLQLLDANDAVLDEIEPLIQQAFGSRVSTKTAAELAPIATRLAEMEDSVPVAGLTPLSSVLALSLAHAIDASVDVDSSKPITAWKNTHLEKDENKNLVFKDRKRSRKLRALSYLYYQYLVKMQESQLYDFDDMVLRVVHAMEVFPDLAYNLQEKYLYVMVDEFQDTNLAQARILHNLTNTETGDEPNIMVVGDDDQAIYSFQGAEVGNILSFRERFKDVPIITLTENYRSADTILQSARSVILQGQNRLERHIEEIDKTLHANRQDPGANVSLTQFARVEDERRGIAQSIRAQLNSGTSASSIAVLARRHHELVSLLPYLEEQNIEVNYERRDNVLESEVIVQLHLLSRIVCNLALGEIDKADALLPKLLAHPAWGFNHSSIWQLSVNAYRHRGSWLEEMSTNPAYMPLHTWLVALGRDASVEPVEYVIDRMTGTPNEDRNDGVYHSPLFDYFFSEDVRSSNPDRYITYLEALRTIRSELREYRPDHSISLHDFIEFIQLHERFGRAITSVRVRSDYDEDAINLMTAHKSKGLEFDHVYVMGAVDTSWGEQVRTRSRNISYPENLPLMPSGDSLDERLRLFYVAMTRARSSLHVSYSDLNENGRETLPASFLVESSLKTHVAKPSEDPSSIVDELRDEWYRPYVSNKKGLDKVLSHTLENYKLSITHLTSFLDISRGGPDYFLLNNLLHFPSVKHPSAQYGSAMHSSLQRAHSHYSATGKKKPIEDVLQDFEQILSGYRMPSRELSQYLQKGTASLSTFLEQNYETFTPTQRVEIGFGAQQSRVGSALLTGSLDLIDIDETNRSMTVTDYKTGAPSISWKGKTDNERVKLHKYRQQLMFYKLLVEHSRDFSRYTVDRGVLQFVEPTRTGETHSLDLSFSKEEMDEFAQLVESVYMCITSLRLPSVESYPPTLAGVLAFEDDIRNDRC